MGLEKLAGGADQARGTGIAHSWAIASVRYTAGIVDLTAKELKAVSKKAKKLMTTNGELHPQADMNTLY